jgi:mono/diheme cytochrome c family protein
MKRTFFGSAVLLAALMALYPGSMFSGPPAVADNRLSIDGRALYRDYCASCHGVEARGGGPVAQALNTPPPDLTRISARNGGTFPLDRVSRIISGYDKAPGAHGSADMPVWGPVFSRIESDRELGRLRIDSLAKYLSQIQKP